MAGTRAALAFGAAIVAAIAVVSGGSDRDPRTPAALPGLPPPFLGTAVVGSGGATAAVDAYGDVVDLRAPGPVGSARVAVSAARQAAGSVPTNAGVVARMSVGGKSIPLWRADTVWQRYLPETNVLRTVARAGDTSTTIVREVGGQAAARADRR